MTSFHEVAPIHANLGLMTTLPKARRASVVVKSRGPIYIFKLTLVYILTLNLAGVRPSDD